MGIAPSRHSFFADLVLGVKGWGEGVGGGGLDLRGQGLGVRVRGQGLGFRVTG